jgi:hypothetical protein
MVKKPKSRRESGSHPRPTKGQGQVRTLQLDFRALLKKRNLGTAKPLIEAIENKCGGTRLLCLVYNDTGPPPAMLAPAVLIPLERTLSQLGKVPRLDLFLRSAGGIAEVPWRVVSLLREASDKLGVIVSRIALSGATHIAIAADELVMTPYSVLGSVDPKRNHPLLPKDADDRPIPTSVEDLKHCIRFISEQLGDSYPKQNLALIISELFKYINPLAIGALEQSYNLSKLITRKSLKTRKEPLKEDHIEKIVDQLAGKYYSHSFHISRSEVESDLGLPVTKPDAELSNLIADLDNYYTEQFKKIEKVSAPNAEPLFRVGGVIQVADGGWAIVQVLKQDGKMVTDPWIEFISEGG